MNPGPPISRGLAAQAACILEATAPKPGNVHRLADFDDASYQDFLLSAAAIAPAMDDAPGVPIGATIARALAATRGVCRTNTNLGMVLLFAPLAAVPDGVDLRAGVARALAGTTVEDAAEVYAAILASRPGGLGEVADQDVRRPPSVTLVEAMRLAAGRDLVARQYAGDYADVFDRALPALLGPLAEGRSTEAAIVGCHLRLMAEEPDTLIARKVGPAVAEEARRRASEVLGAGWPDAAGSAGRLAEFDAWLRADGNRRNPGATADLVAAGLFAALRAGTIDLAAARDGWSRAGPTR